MSLRAVIAPRLARPGPPVVRSSPVAVGAGTEVSLRLEASSPIPVQSFRLLRTRSDRAALRADTMGPAFAEPVADVKLDDSIPAQPKRDPVTGDPVYVAEWQGALPPAWTPWLVRATAVPQPTEPQRAIRGLDSAPSDIVSVLAAPDTPPVLDDLSFAETDAAHTGLVIRTATTAPAIPLALGDHTLRARITDASATPIDIGPATLASLDETPLSTPPSGPAVWQRGTRAGGRSPLAVWFTRADAAASVTIEALLTDPRGRATTRTVTIPGWTPPPPPAAATLELLGITPRPLSGVTVGVLTDAAFDKPYRLRVKAARRTIRGPFRPLLPLRRPLVVEVDLADIPAAPRPPIVVGKVSFRRVRRVRRVRPFAGTTIEIGVPLPSPLSVTVTLIAPDGTVVSVTGNG